MKKRVIRVVALCVALLFLLGVVAPVLVSKVYGEPVELSPWQQMQEYEKELNRLAEEGRVLEEKKLECETELEETKEELVATEELETEQMTKFRGRFAALCDRGAASYLEILFSAECFSDLIEKFVIVREIAEYDKSILTTIANLKEEIKTEQQRLEELLAEIEASEAELQTNQAEVQKKLDEAIAYQKKLEEDRRAYSQYLSDKDAAEQRTKGQAGISGGVGTVAPGRVSSGSLLWPTNTGYITSNFSPNRVNPVTGILRPHTGTDIGAGMGAPVWASQGGTVILAEYNGGYGNCVILDHGNGIKTLYGHMSSIMVGQGQSVSQGTQIGRVGSTGNSTGPHLHFEVLVDGVAVDPMQFF